MPGRKDTASFIAEARAVHGDRYDYSRVVYIEYRKRVEIVCPVHGSFWQTPALHVKGRNCRKCAHQKRTESVAAFCRFCGVRVLYHDAQKRRCQSAECVRLHKIEKRRAIGDAEVDSVRQKWSREKQRQKAMAKSEIEKRCQRAYHSAWRAKRYRTSNRGLEKKPEKPLTEKVIKERQRNKVRWARMTPIEKKVKRFCRDTNSGRRHMAKRKGSVRMRELLEKLSQQGNRCALTGEPIDHTNSEIDHIVPVSRGGNSEIENLQWLSKKANRMKGTMTNEEFVEACLMVVKHTLRPLPHA